MQNQNDDTDLGDDIYDEVLDENFEDDFDDADFAGMDLDEEIGDLDDLEDFSDEGGSTDFSDEFTDEFDDDGEWGDEDAPAPALGAEKKKSKVSLSFNAMMIIGALVAGVGVLAFQILTTESKVTVDNFVSALNMSGASDGPVFGGDEAGSIDSTQIGRAEAENTSDTKGFLHEPDILDSMEMELKESPPMPSPIASGTLDDVAQAPADTVASADSFGQDQQVPRGPDGFGENDTVDVFGNSDVEITAEPETPTEGGADTAQTQSAEDVLKRAMAAREQKEQAAKAEQDRLEAARVEQEKRAQEQREQERLAQEKAEQEKAAQEKVAQENAAREKLAQAKAAEEARRLEAQKIEVANQAKRAAEQQAAAQITAQESAPVEGNNNAAASADISRKLDLIVSRLDEMELQITQIREKGDLKIEDVSQDLASLKQEMGAIVKAPAPKKAAPKVVKKSKPKPKAKATPKASPKATSKISWELRAAQPGKAWVSKKGQRDVRPVVVGDSLSGIGRITAISYNGARWSVQGTSGRILQ